MKYFLFLLLTIVACRPSNRLGELVGVPKKRTLENTVWVLKELSGKVIESAPQRAIYIQFNSAKGALTGFAGCNTITGSYSKNGSSIESKVASTKMFCDGKMDDEAAFIKLLTQPAKYKVDKHMLHVEQDGHQVALFHAEIKTTD